MRTYCREFQPCVRFASVIAPSALRTMASRQERLDALNQFRSRVPHLSQRALAGILGIARAETLPRDHKRSSVRQARDQLVHTPRHTDLFTKHVRSHWHLVVIWTSSFRTR